MSRESNRDDVQRAVVDRIADGWAILLIGEQEQERRLRASELPEGAGEGSILTVRLVGVGVEIVAIDDAAAEEKRSEMRDRLSALKRTRSRRRFQSSE